MSALTREKLAQATQLVAASDLDLWLTFVRETSGHADPVLGFLTESALTWQSALMVARSGVKAAVVGNYDADPLTQSGDWDTVTPYVQGIREPLLETLEALVPATVAAPRIGVNVSESDDKADGLTVGMWRLLQRYLAGTRFENSLVSAEEIVSALRGRKTATELVRLRDAIVEGDALFDEIGRLARVGMTEVELFDLVQDGIAARGLGYAWEKSGDPIVNFGPASMVGHGVPSPRIRLERGHILHVDLGVQTAGYCSDIQRCWFVGDDIPEAATRACDAVVGAISAGAAALKPSASGWQVDAAARSFVTAAGYPEYLHALGHQVGRMAHDGGGILGPRWERYGDTPERQVEPGQVYTLELGVFVDGHGYLGIEEMVVVTDRGCEFLSDRQTQLWRLPL